MQRYATRPDPEGWAVFDIFRGEAVVIAMLPQTGLDLRDADELIAAAAIPHDRQPSDEQRQLFEGRTWQTQR